MQQQKLFPWCTANLQLPQYNTVIGKLALICTLFPCLENWFANFNTFSRIWDWIVDILSATKIENNKQFIFSKRKVYWKSILAIFGLHRILPREKYETNLLISLYNIEETLVWEVFSFPQYFFFYLYRIYFITTSIQL